MGINAFWSNGIKQICKGFRLRICYPNMVESNNWLAVDEAKKVIEVWLGREKDC